MNKEIFISELKKELRDFSQTEIDDIVFEYETEIDEQISRGNQEIDVVNKLGNPHDIALEFLANKTPNSNIVSQENDRNKNIIIFVLVQVFNLIIVSWLYLGLLLFIVSLILTGLLTFSFAIWSIFYFSLIALIYFTTLTIFLISFALLLLVITYKYTKKYYVLNKTLYGRIN